MKVAKRHWYGLAIMLAAMLLLWTWFAPESLGTAGTWSRLRLNRFFGSGSVPGAVLLSAIGAFLLLARRPLLRVSGALMVSLPAVVIGSMVSGGDALAVGFLQQNLSSAIGPGGMWALLGGAALGGALMMVPMRVLKGCMPKRKQRPLAPPPLPSDPGHGETVLEPDTLSMPDHPDQEHLDTPSAMSADTPLPEAQQSDFSPEHRQHDDTPLMLKCTPFPGNWEEVAVGLFAQHTSIPPTSAQPGRRDAIIEAFDSYGVKLDIGDITSGPSFEQYELLPGAGVKIAKIRSVAEDVSVRLKARCAIAQRPTDGALVIELPVAQRASVPYGYLLECTDDDHFRLPIALGVDASYVPHSADLTEMPHMLVAGTTGSGKSVFLKTLISSLIYHKTPNQVRLVLIDPKRVEFSLFANTSYLAHDIITEIPEAIEMFEALTTEMEHRYQLLGDAGCTSIDHYIARGNTMAYIVVVVDEFADLFLSARKEIGDYCIRLAQKARACGIHLVLATQRPSAHVFDGLLKTNIPGRVALSVASTTDSRIILDRSGAECLTGKGDMICMTPDFREGIRLQGAFLSDSDCETLLREKSSPRRYDSITSMLTDRYRRQTCPVFSLNDTTQLIFPQAEHCLFWECADPKTEEQVLDSYNNGTLDDSSLVIQSLDCGTTPDIFMVYTIGIAEEDRSFIGYSALEDLPVLLEADQEPATWLRNALDAAQRAEVSINISLIAMFTDVEEAMQYLQDHLPNYQDPELQQDDNGYTFIPGDKT